MCEARRSQLSRVMRRGHKLASKMEGDYKVRLSLALRLAWEEEKGGNEMSGLKLQKTKIEKETIEKATGKSFEELKIERFKSIEGELRVAGCWSYRSRMTEEELAKILKSQEEQKEQEMDMEEKAEKEVLKNIERLAQEVDGETLEALRKLWSVAKGHGGFYASEAEVKTNIGVINYEDSVVKGLERRGIKPVEYL